MCYNTTRVAVLYFLRKYCFKIWLWNRDICVVLRVIIQYPKRKKSQGTEMNIIKKMSDFFKNYKSLALILIVCTAFFLLIFNANSSVVEKEKADVTFSYVVSNDSMSIHDYSVIDGNYYVNQSADPQIYISPDNPSATNDVTVKFAEPLEQQMSVQLFAEHDNCDCVEAHIYAKTVKKGATEVFFTLPDNVYTFIRLDINGSFRLDSITASHLENTVYYKALQVNWTTVIIWLALLVAAVVFSFVFKDRIEPVYRKFIDKYFSFENKDLLSEKKNTRKLANRYTLIALLFGALLLIFMPALAVPDENFHFLNVLRVSHFQFVPSVKDGVAGVYLTSDEVAFLDEFGDVLNFRMTWSKYSDIVFTNNCTTEFYATNWANTNCFGHFLPGMAVAFARLFFKRLDVYSCLLIARFTNLLISVLITRYALTITPVFKNTMFLLALMPITLQQAASTSYDAILNASAFLLFAATAKIVMKNDDYRITAKDVFIVLVSVAGLCITKAPYVFLALILFSINIKKFGSIKKYFTCIVAIIACGLVFYLIPTLAFNNAIAEISQQSNNLSQMQIDFLLSDLGNIPKMFKETFDLCHESWEIQFIGVLGWMDFGLPYFGYVAFCIIFWITFIYDACTAGRVPLKLRIFSVLSALLIYITVIMSMYILRNAQIGAIGKYVAYGVQGRYFIPITIFAAVMFSNPLLVKFKHSKRLESNIRNVIGIASVVLIVTAFVAFFQRYWI